MIIAGTGGAVHLPGMIAAKTLVPVHEYRTFQLVKSFTFIQHVCTRLYSGGLQKPSGINWGVQGGQFIKSQRAMRAGMLDAALQYGGTTWESKRSLKAGGT